VVIRYVAAIAIALFTVSARAAPIPVWPYHTAYYVDWVPRFPAYVLYDLEREFPTPEELAERMPESYFFNGHWNGVDFIDQPGQRGNEWRMLNAQ
jgi:hypothetical protein